MSRNEFDGKHETALAEIRALYQSDFERINAVIEQPNYKAADFLEGTKKPTTQARAEAAEKAKDANIELRARKAGSNP